MEIETVEIRSTSQSDGLPTYGYVTFEGVKPLRFLRDYRASPVFKFFFLDGDASVEEDADAGLIALAANFGGALPTRHYAAYADYTIFGLGGAPVAVFHDAVRRFNVAPAHKTARVTDSFHELWSATSAYLRRESTCSPARTDK